MATISSSEEGGASSVSNRMYGGGRWISSMIIGGDFLSMSLSDIDDLLPDLSDDGMSDLFLFLRTKTQAKRKASAAPTKRQPIAMPTVWPRESPDLSFDEDEVVCAMLEDVGVATMVGEDRLALLGVRDVDMTFGDVALDGALKSVEDNNDVVSSLVIVGVVEESPGDALDEGDALKFIVTPSEFSKTIDTGAADGIVENVRFASRWRVKGVMLWLVARAHGSLNVHVGVYITVVSVVKWEEDMSSAWQRCSYIGIWWRSQRCFPTRCQLRWLKRELR